MTDPAWPFTDAPNTAVITHKSILRGERPIRLVTHDLDDGMWQFLDGQPATEAEAAVVGLATIARLDPSVLTLADLGPGMAATRSDVQEAWTIGPR
jgi:hypothetical protein